MRGRLTCEVPPMMSTGTPASSRACNTPRWASPLDPPPERTSPTALPAIHRPNRARSCSVSLVLARADTHRALFLMSCCRSVADRQASRQAAKAHSGHVKVLQWYKAVHKRLVVIAQYVQRRCAPRYSKIQSTECLLSALTLPMATKSHHTRPYK